MLAAFYGALIGLALLFALRFFEDARGVRLAPRVRRALDRFALVIKRRLQFIGALLERIPVIVGLLARFVAAKGVRRFAHLAGGLSRAAHSAADMVSYKHRYERRETRSTFLKRVSGQEDGSSNEE